MARLPGAVWDPIVEWPTGPYADDGDPADWKVVWHTTQGHTYPRGWYAQRGGVPTGTIDLDGTLYQHYDTTHYSRALLNLPGGVETNLDQAIQFEIVGYAGQSLTRKQLDTIVRVIDDLERLHGIPPTWMNGRPAISYAEANAPGHRLTFAEWDHGTGHCGHSDAPEQSHWDPAFTDRDWAYITADTPASNPPIRVPPRPIEGETTVFAHGTATDRRIYTANYVTVVRDLKGSGDWNFSIKNIASGAVTEVRHGKPGDKVPDVDGAVIEDGGQLHLHIERGNTTYRKTIPVPA